MNQKISAASATNPFVRTTSDRGYTAISDQPAFAAPTSRSFEEMKFIASLDETDSGHFNDQQDDAIERTIANFTPKMSRQLWRAVGNFTRSAVTDFAPAHVREAELVMSAVARLVAWSRESAGMKLERATVFSGNNVEVFIKRGLENYSAYSAADARRYLMRVARELGVVEMERVASRPARKPSMQQPYSDAEMRRFRAMTAYLSTELRRYSWSVYLCLAGGCALSAFEITQVKRSDITDTDTGIAVRIDGREVTCSVEFEDDLRSALRSTRGGAYLFPFPRTNPYYDRTSVRERIRKMAGVEPVPAPGRLRATWIVGQLNRNTPVRTLMAALGVTTLRPLEGYLRFVSEADAVTARAQLRGAVSE